MQNNNEKVKIDIKKRTYIFALEIIKLIDSLNKKDFSIEIISKQLIRSATSIGANIIEAQAGSTKRDFVNYIQHSLKSANETKFWLCLLRDSRAINIDKVLKENIELANILAAIVISAKNKNKF